MEARRPAIGCGNSNKRVTRHTVISRYRIQRVAAVESEEAGRDASRGTEG